MEHHLSTPRTARYYVSHERDNYPGKALIVIHGYGQLARYFFQKFNSIFEDTLVIAPEGLSRYYLDGSYGRVGASWMTKEDRLMDIQDNLHYLDNLYYTIKKNYPGIDNLSVLGFSQGGATAARWAFATTHHLNDLILYASVFPPDVELTVNGLKQFKRLTLVWGKQDEYLREGQIEEQRIALQSLNPRLIEFEGGHEIDPGVLKNLLT